MHLCYFQQYSCDFCADGREGKREIFFKQAIDLTPDGEKYDDPYIGLEMLNKK